MDQGPLVIEQVESGKRFIEALEADGIDLRVAFWAQLPESEKWYLYLALPVVDEKGPAAAYRLVHDCLRKMPEVWIDPFEIRVVGLKDSLTEGALAVIEPKLPNGPFAARNPRPYPGMTRLGGTTLGGVSIDGAYIYPPTRTGASI